MKNLSKFNKIILPIAVIALILSITYSSFAIYKSSVKGTSEFNTADWEIKLNNQNITTSNTFTFSLNDATWTHKSDINTEGETKKVIAPGSVGVYTLGINAENTEVEVQYDVTVKVKQDDTVIDISTLNPNLTIGVYKDDTLQSSPARGFIDAGGSQNLDIKIIWNDVDDEDSNEADVGIKDSNFVIEVTVVTKQRTVLDPVYPEGKNKETAEVGDIVKIGDEEFFVVRHDGDDLVLLTKYNLYVGNKYNFQGNYYGTISEDDPKYLKQESSAFGNMYYSNNINQATATVRFSTENYWGYDNTYPLEIYDPNRDAKPVFNSENIITENYSVAYYVKEYEKYLETLTKAVKGSRLLTYQEAVDLGCDFINRNCSASAENQQFVYYTSYWLSTASSYDFLYVIHKGGYAYTNGTYHNNRRGVRPVIII